MLMNNYEHTFVLKQDLSEKQQKNLISKYEDIVKNNMGKIMGIENWGFLNFSYPIKKNKRGFYIHFKIEGSGTAVRELENAERIDTGIIRFLTVKVKTLDLKTKYFEAKNY